MQFDRKDEIRIVAAIRAAELQTSGEIRLFVEDFCLPDDPVDRAVELFYKLGMTQTKARNGVLLYLATRSRHFAIWGDSGIHEKVGLEFWDDEKQLLREYLSRDAMVDGLCAVVEQIGEQMKAYFPADPSDNENELPDDILYG